MSVPTLAVSDSSLQRLGTFPANRLKMQCQECKQSPMTQLHMQLYYTDLLAGPAHVKQPMSQKCAAGLLACVAQADAADRYTSYIAQKPTDMKSPYDLSVPHIKHANAARSLREALAARLGPISVSPTAPCINDVSPRKIAASSCPSPLDAASVGPSALKQCFKGLRRICMSQEKPFERKSLTCG